MAFYNLRLTWIFFFVVFYYRVFWYCLVYSCIHSESLQMRKLFKWRSINTRIMYEWVKLNTELQSCMETRTNLYENCRNNSTQWIIIVFLGKITNFVIHNSTLIQVECELWPTIACLNELSLIKNDKKVN